MVEMVIILPVLLMILFAIVEFGVLFGRWQTVTNAAREGARTAILYRVGCNTGTVENEVRTVVRNYASDIGIALVDSDITVSGVCGLKDTSSSVNVVLPYTFRVLPGIASSVSPTIDLVATSVMRNEGSG